jgi:photosystem II stability/assembly factor-like uncharacterized protein
VDFPRPLLHHEDMSERVLVATGTRVVVFDPGQGRLDAATGLDDARPTGLCADPHVPGLAWCCTHRRGVFRTDDGGASWSPSGLEGERLMVITASPARPGTLWAGAEPSAVWRSDDSGRSWRRTAALETLPSSGEWAFPPRPDTHHVRWIACHPTDEDRVWVAIEAGALVSTRDGGETWLDRVPGGPCDTHECAVHRDAPEVLRVAAGDGFFESRDGAAHWASPMAGLDVGYLRSVTIDPGDRDTVVVSAATHAHAAYAAGRSDGRVYRRVGVGTWQRVEGWPDPALTIAPLLAAGRRAGELWAADERGVHSSVDGGSTWRQVAELQGDVSHLRGLASLPTAS